MKRSSNSARLRGQADIVIVEGAGSPAEINLRAGDIANMGFARAANVPVVLVGDIDRGGVIAAVVGTRSVIDPEDAAIPWSLSAHPVKINSFATDVHPQSSQELTSAKALHKGVQL